jgi:hypothetical protein
MRWLVVLACLPLCRPAMATESAPAGIGAESVARFAVVIGRNEPEDPGQGVLRYADDDAIAMHDLLEEAGVRSLLLVSPDADTASLHKLDHTEKPTLAAVLAAFGRLAKEIQAAKALGKRTELTLFYSGHGDVADGEGFVVLDGGRLTRTALLESVIARSPADTNHVIVDACKSYFLVFEKGPGGERRPFYRSFAAFGSHKNLDRTGFVLSSSSHEESHEWERYQAGIFSYEVRSALRGSADADLDGRITYGELGAFITTANRGIANAKLRPDFLVSPPGKRPGNLAAPLLRWDDHVANLTVDPTATGHYYIETAVGIRVADVHPKHAQLLALHLPSARPLFVRQADDRVEGELVSNEPMRLSALAMRPATIARKGALSLAFETLFSTPFGSETVRAYDALFAEKSAGLPSAVPESDRTQRIRPILLAVGAGSLALGGTMTILALRTRSHAGSASQTDISAMNRTIDRYNTAAIVLYSVAAASGISWLTLKLLSREKPADGMIVVPIVSPTELSVGLAVHWGD